MSIGGDQTRMLFAPVTGVVIRRQDAENGGTAFIHIFIFPWQPHTIFAPVAGIGKVVALRNGARIPAFFRQAINRNKRLDLEFNGLGPDAISMRVVGGLTTFTLRPLIKDGETVDHHSPVATIILGSMVELRGPIRFGTKVAAGRSLRVGQVIGDIVGAS